MHIPAGGEEISGVRCVWWGVAVWQINRILQAQCAQPHLKVIRRVPFVVTRYFTLGVGTAHRDTRRLWHDVQRNRHLLCSQELGDSGKQNWVARLKPSKHCKDLAATHLIFLSTQPTDLVDVWWTKRRFLIPFGHRHSRPRWNERRHTFSKSRRPLLPASEFSGQVLM